MRFDEVLGRLRTARHKIVLLASRVSHPRFQRLHFAPPLCHLRFQRLHLCQRTINVRCSNNPRLAVLRLTNLQTFPPVLPASF